MSNTYMPLYGVFDTTTGALQGVCPVSGVASSVSGTPISVTGTPTVGSVLTAVLATGWTAAGYQWTRDGANISGATSSTYTLVSADSGHVVGVNVSTLVYTPTGQTITAGAATVPVITTAPLIATITAGSAVSWTAGNVTGTPTPTVTYSLKKNAGGTGSFVVVSSNATSGSYSSTTAGDIFIVTQSATNSAGSATPVDSSQVTVIASLPSYANASETTSIISAMTSSGTTPNSQRQYTIDRWIKKMKAQGVWAKLSRLWIVGDTSGQTLINWVSPGTGDLTVAGTPVFTAPAAGFAAPADNVNGGYKASATTMYLETGVPLSTLYAAGTFAFGAYVGTTGALAIDFGSKDTTAGAFVYSGGPSNPPVVACCDIGATIGANGNTDGVGLISAVRTSSTSITTYHNSVALATTALTLASPTAPTRTMRLLTATAPTSFSGKAFQGAYIALQALTAADVDMLYRAMRSIIESIQYGDVLLNESGYAPQAVSTQAVVYGWTLQSILCAEELARQGKTVALVGGWRDISLGSLGGVSANGLNRTDLSTRSAIGGLSNLFLTRCNGVSGVSDLAANISTDPRVVSLMCRQTLDPSRTGGQNVHVYSTGGVASVSMSGTNIASITTVDGRTFTGTQFHDGTYEGDLMALALPSAGWTSGREAAGTGTEALNGFGGYSSTNLPCKNPGGTPTYYTIDPFVTPGVTGSGTIAGVNPTFPSEAVGQADGSSQAFNFRLTLSSSTQNGIPLPTTPPSGYSSSNYELYGRLAAAMVAGSTTYALTDGFLAVAVPGSKLDVNNVGTTSSDYQNHSGDYINAVNYAAREVSWQAHMGHARGLLYYYTQDSDSRISGQPIRTSLAAYRLPVDTYLDPHPNDQPYWPGQLYVREMRRLVGPMIWNGSDFSAADGTTPRSTNTVGTVSYSIDSHSSGRYAYNNAGTWQVVSEGTFGQGIAGNAIQPVPFEVCVPQAAHCTNLSVSFCFSATHVAFGAMRMELTSSQIAQSMGMAMAIAIENGSTIQAVPYSTLRTRLLASPSLSGEVAPVLPQLN